MDHSEPNLILIEKGDLKKVYQLFQDDYYITSSMIQDYLSVSRPFLENHIRNNVRHIFLNSRIRAALSKTYSVKLKDYIFYSNNDFKRFISENINAKKQSILIDFCEYSEDKQHFQEVLSDSKTNITLRETMLYNLLSPAGKLLWDNTLSDTASRSEYKQLDVQFKLPETSFVSVADLGFPNNETAYRFIFNSGLTRYYLFKNRVLLSGDEVEKVKKLKENNCMTGLLPYGVFLKLIN